ncbi:MAG: ribosome biogenesis GTPase YlqF [Oscillospiraceae bacterium]|nr:ribosome biogenesis GTPase YlqF [Oscillospiraceae bacterium]
MEQDAVHIHWFPGHMMKTLRLIAADIKNVDLVIELLDARIPASSKNPELAVLTRGKPQLLLLNKSDLADADATRRWIDAYKKNGCGAVAVSARDRALRATCSKAANALLSEKLARAKERGTAGQRLRAMVVGVPNVGKSTLINTLAGGALTKTEDRPGVTRGKQWITTPEFELLDMPGVLWRKFDSPQTGLKLAFTGAIKDDVFDTEQVAACLLSILAQRYPDRLSERFKLTQAELAQEGWQLLEAAARRRGLLLGGGICDTARAAAAVLDELRAGKLGRITFEEPENDL